MSAGTAAEQMTREELAEAVRWAAEEGWNPGLDDAECFFRCDPGAYMCVKNEGRMIGAVSAAAYGDDFGFIGLFIVRPPFRGHLAGKVLGFAAMERLAGRNIGLDGVEKKIKNYSNFGFKAAHNNIRFEGVMSGARPEFSARAVKLSALAFADVETFDKRFFQAPRAEFLKGWISPRGGSGLAIVSGGAIIASGVARPCLKGFKIGPLFAESESCAAELLDSLLTIVPDGQPFYLDVPEPNRSALALTKAKGMRPVFKTVRMYSKEAPPLPLGQIYGITTFELG